MNQSILKTIFAWSLGIVYLYFGALKLFAGVSPAENLVVSTVDELFLHLIPESISIYIVAFWEVLLGVLLLLRVRLKAVSVGVLLHMAFTFTPLVLFPALCFDPFPVPTLLGQYIIKNLVLVGAGLGVFILADTEN